MEACTIFDELRKIEREQSRLSARRGELIEELQRSDFDWVKVSDAARIFSMSPAAIYARVNSGRLESRHRGSCVLVSKSEIEQIDDRYKVRELR